jgi:AraC-like DNA-binding protein
MKGPLGLLIREQRDVRRALEALRHYLSYQNDNVEIRVEPVADGVMVSPALLSQATRSSRLMIELSVAMYMELFRALLGADWRPAEVCFAHAAPADMAPYERQLGRVRFGAKTNGFVLTNQDLATPLPQADEGLASEIARFIEATGRPRATSVVEQVAGLIHRLLPQGACGVDEVARQMGVDRRTIHRRLAAEHASFTQILEEVRRRMAADLLEHGDEPLGAITRQLGFSSLSAFSRWFHNAFGIQPREFRRLSHTA